MKIGFIDKVSIVTGAPRDVVVRELKIIVYAGIGTVLAVLLTLILFPRFSIIAAVFVPVPVVLVWQRIHNIRKYFEFMSSLSKEETYSSIAMLVLSLLGSWTYIGRVLESIFPATAKFVKFKLVQGPKLLQEVRYIIDTVVFKDGTLPHVARDRIVSNIKNSVETLGLLVEAITTSLSMLYVFYIISNFVSFLQFGSLKPSVLLIMTILLTFMFALLISSRSPVHDYGLEELKSKIVFVLVPVLLSFTISYTVLRNVFSCLTLSIIVFCLACILLLRKSAKLDKIDHAVVWDHVINVRVIRGSPVDQTLRRILGEDLYELYSRTYPFSAIRNLIKHLEEAGGLDVIGLLRQMLVELFESAKKVSKTVTMSVIVLALFAAIMLGMQVWYVKLLYPMLLTLHKAQAFSSSISISGISLPFVLKPRDLVNSLVLSASTVPPAISLATFLIVRAAAGTTRAAKLTLIITVMLFALQVYILYFVLPSLHHVRVM